MEKIIHIQGHIGGVSTLKDRTVKLTIISAKEMTDPNELAQLFSINEEVVSIGMKVGHISKEDMIDIPEPQKDYRDEKSPGQRLRSAWFRLWEQQGKQGDFETFYKNQMERLINQIKEKLV